MSWPGVVTEAAQGYAAPPSGHVKAETARAVRQRIRSGLEWAIAMDLRHDNPCDRVLPVLGPQNARRREVARVPHAEREADFPVDVAEDAPVPRVRGRGARLPLVGPGLGGGGDRPSTRGHRGGAGPRRSEHGRGRLCPRRPVRAAADRRLGGVCRSARITGSVDRAAALQTVIGTTASRVRSSDRSATLSSTTPPRTG